MARKCHSSRRESPFQVPGKLGSVSVSKSCLLTTPQLHATLRAWRSSSENLAIGRALSIAQQATGKCRKQYFPKKDPTAICRDRLGGIMGGLSRANPLTSPATTDSTVCDSKSLALQLSHSKVKKYALDIYLVAHVTMNSTGGKPYGTGSRSRSNASDSHRS